MSLVTEYVEERQNEIQSQGALRQNMRRVTVRLPADIFAMLAEVAKDLEDTNTGCAEGLLSAAITEAWKTVKPRTVEDIQRVMSAPSIDAKEATNKKMTNAEAANDY